MELNADNEVVKEIAQRIKNPFVFSFCVAWIFSNWKVIYGIITFSPSDFEKFHVLGKTEYGKDIFDFVSRTITADTGFKYPCYIAFIYTFGLPILKQLIIWYNTQVNKRGTIAAEKAAKGGFIEYELYLEELKSRQEEKKESLELLRNAKENKILLESAKIEISDFTTEMGAIKQQLKHYETNTSHLSQKVSSLEFSNSINLCDGYWITSNFSPLHDIINSDTKGNEALFVIKNGYIDIYMKTGDQKAFKWEYEIIGATLSYNKKLYFITIQESRYRMTRTRIYLLCFSFIAVSEARLEGVDLIDEFGQQHKMTFQSTAIGEEMETFFERIIN